MADLRKNYLDKAKMLHYLRKRYRTVKNSSTYAVLIRKIESGEFRVKDDICISDKKSLL